MINLTDNDESGRRVSEQVRGRLAAVSLAALIAVALGGCSAAPGASKPQVKAAVAKPKNTYVVHRASVRTPRTAQARKQQVNQVNRSLTASVRKNWEQAQKRAAAQRKQAASAQLAARKRAEAARQLSSAKYHARYAAEQRAAKKAAIARREAKARALVKQQQAKQAAIRKQHVAEWEQQQRKRLSYNTNWAREQAQKRLLANRKAELAAKKVALARTSAVKSPVSKVARKSVYRKPVIRKPVNVAARRPASVRRSPVNHRAQAIRLAAQRKFEAQQKLVAQRRLQAQRAAANAKRSAEAQRQSQASQRQKYIALWERKKAEQAAQKRAVSQQAAQKVEQVIHNAKKQIGRKYVWGGASPAQGFDCSGLVQHSIREGANVKVPRTAAQQYKAAVKVPANQAQRGDLVFFITRGKSVSHVGIYLGNNKFVHAPRTGKRVTTTKMTSYWKKRFVGFGRIPGACRLPI